MIRHERGSTLAVEYGYHLSFVGTGPDGAILRLTVPKGGVAQVKTADGYITQLDVGEFQPDYSMKPEYKLSALCVTVEVNPKAENSLIVLLVVSKNLDPYQPEPPPERGSLLVVEMGGGATPMMAIGVTGFGDDYLETTECLPIPATSATS